jgi:hypothetical protein
MNLIVPPRASLALSLALVAPTAGCVLITDFQDPTEEGSESSVDPPEGSSTVGPSTVGMTTVDSATTVDMTDASTTGDTLEETSNGSDTTMGAGAMDTFEETDSEPEPEPEPLPDCPGVGLGGAALGEACASNQECASGVCTIYTDAPLDLDAVCASPAADCSMRVTGTSRDLVTGQPLSGSELRVVSAVSAVTDPIGAPAIVAGVSGIDGRLDVVTPGQVSGPIGLVALVDGPGYHLTGTIVAVPWPGSSEFGVANDVHDLWLVSNAALTAWSAMLASDPEISVADLPLGTLGGSVGLVRDAAGVPVSGATVSSTNAGSQALVRYLNDDGTFGTTATGNLGVFVIIDANLAEQFEAELDGMSLGVATTASQPDVVLTLTFTAP